MHAVGNPVEAAHLCRNCCCYNVVLVVSMQRFRRRTVEANEDDSDWAASDGDPASDDEADGTFKPQYAFWAEKGTWKTKSVKGGRGRGAVGATPALNRQRGRQQVPST